MKEKIKLCNVVVHLSTNLMNLDDEQKIIIKNNYDNESLNCLKGAGDYIIDPNDDSDLNHEYSKKMENICLVRDASSKKKNM